MTPERILVLPAIERAGEDATSTGSPRLVAAVAEAMWSCPERGDVVLLVDGPELLVHDVRSVSTPSSVRRPVATATVLLAAIARRGQAPRVPVEELTGPAGALAELVLAHRPGLHPVVVTVPRGADVDALTAVTSGLDGALRAVAGPNVVVALGDLTSNGRRDGGIPEARTADTEVPDTRNQRLVTAVAATDAVAFASSRPHVPEEIPGWAPTMVALTLAASHGVMLEVLAAEWATHRCRVVACGPVGS